MTTKIFFSWQSDTPTKVGKGFIQQALADAIKALKFDAEIDDAIRDDMHLDHDTLDVPGSPPITEIILGKIDDCAAFVYDVTYVATRPNGSKAPNPNVCIELGWALKSRNWQRVFSVLNKAYGDPKECPLPFDLRHMRGPIIYELKEDATPDERKAARDFLTKEIKQRLKSIFAAAEADLLSGGDKFELAKANAAEALWAYQNEAFHGRSPVIITRPKLMVRLVPILVRPPPDLDAKLIARLQNSFAIHTSDRLVADCDAYQWWASDPLRDVERWQNKEATWIMRIKRPGEMEYQVNLGLFDPEFTPESEFTMDGRRLEGIVIRAAEKMCHLLKEVGFSGPALVGVAFDQVGGMKITTPRLTGKKIGNPYFSLPNVMINSLEALDDQAFEHAFSHLWHQSGWPEGSPSFEKGTWEGRANPRLYDLD